MAATLKGFRFVGAFRRAPVRLSSNGVAIVTPAVLNHKAHSKVAIPLVGRAFAETASASLSNAGTIADAAAQVSRLGDWSDAVQVFKMLLAFRRRGHLAARLDPLRGSLHRQLDPEEPIGWRIGGLHGEAVHNTDVIRLLSEYPDRIDLSVFGLEHYNEHDLLPSGVAVPEAWGAGPEGGWTFRSFVDHLCLCYADTLTAELEQIENPTERLWLLDKIEGRPVRGNQFGWGTAEARRKALERLVQSEQLERLLAEKYPSAKRFGIEGCEALLPGLWALLETAAARGVEDLMLGMAHRGRLNVLVNLLGKRVSDICNEFGEQVDFLGDVKYHLGTTGRRDINGRAVQLTLAPNPSHLEAVNPVVLGMTRAKIDYTGDDTMRRTMALLLHGDAAFSGQGVVAEIMQLADLPAYTTGGTIHVIINNMVGFTTDPRSARSSYHCTNMGKVNDAPILHVNADDVDAVLFSCSLAAEYRQQFRKDVIIDLVCYRRHGHSEVDDAGFTQPLTKTSVKQHPPVLQIYSKTLQQEGVVSQSEVDAWTDQIRAEFEAESHYAATSRTRMSEWQVRKWGERPVNVTGIPAERLKLIGLAIWKVPEGFDAHPAVGKIFEKRVRQLGQGMVDWAMAEQLALGTLILKFDPDLHLTLTTGLIDGSGNSDVDRYVVHPPCPVRLSGQDVERGTFNQRHAVIYDQRTARPHAVLNDMGLNSQSRATVCNSSLSEVAILGFEYGYSLEESLALTIWEAQFGDFANCAQHIIDNFIATGESKWGLQSCLVLVLPHGYEGQGPEHSSARLERFLQLIDDDPDNLLPVGPSWLGSLADGEGNPAATNFVSIEQAREVVISALEALKARDRENLDRAWRRVALLQERIDAVHNICVANITTPANLFHILRRQVHRTFAKPLMLMSAKYLLHHRPCRSSLEDMGPGTRFTALIMEDGQGDNIRSKPAADPDDLHKCRLIFCSGKVFYELHHARAARNLQSRIALARLEQLAPFPAIAVAICASRYPNAEILWVQEEPKNMGAWTYVAPRIKAALKHLSPAHGVKQEVRYVGRPSSANPATPLFKQHKQEVRAILDEALCPKWPFDF